MTARDFWLGRLRVRNAASMLAGPPRDYLVKGLISSAELSVWWGPPKSGKSFLVLHVTYALAQGRSVFGRRVKKSPVLYLAAEGAAGLGARIRALRERYGVADEFYLVAQSVDLRNGSAPGSEKIQPSERESLASAGGGHVGELIALVRTLGAKVVVVDTLNRALAGGDENGPKDMGAFIANTTHLIHETGAHVLVIHHGTKSEHSTPRGHSSLIGAADLVVEVTRVKDGAGPLLGSAMVTAAKDDPDGVAMGFSAEAVRIGVDSDGDPVTTLLVRELDAAPSVGRKSKRDTALGMLRDLVAREGCPNIKLDVWKQACLEGHIFGDVKEESAERSWRRLKEELEKAGRVVLEKGFVRLATAEETAGALQL